MSHITRDVIWWAWEHEHEQVSMSKGAWTWKREHKHEQVNMSKGAKPNLFFNILPMWTWYLKNILSHLGYNIWWRGRIFFHVTHMNNIYGWKLGWKMTMDELFHEHSQLVLFCKKMNKKRIQKIYVGLLWPISHMKCSSYTWTSISYSNFVASKPYKIWDYIKFKGTYTYWSPKGYVPIQTILVHHKKVCDH
jgi:hypothetical protein